MPLSGRSLTGVVIVIDALGFFHQRVLKRPPRGYRFTRMRRTSKLRLGCWWDLGGSYGEIWPDEHGKTVEEASSFYQDGKTMVAYRLVKV